MAEKKTIAIRLSLEDADKVRDMLKQMGEEGQKALATIDKAGAKTAPGLLALNDVMGDIKASASGLTAQLGPAGSALAALGPAGLAAGAAIGGLAALQFKAIHAFVEMEKTSVRLDATLKATGNTTGFTRQRLDEMADSLSKLTAIDDDDIKAAMATLATFGAVGGKAFENTLKVGADLSVLLGGDLTSNVEKVATTMERLAGGSADGLKKAFSFLSQEQVNFIAKLAEGGQTIEAQQALLDALKGKVDNLSGADAATVGGGFRALGNAWEDFLENIAVTEPVVKATKLLTELLDAVNRALGHKDDLRLSQISSETADLKKRRAMFSDFMGVHYRGADVIDGQIAKLDAEANTLLQARNKNKMQQELDDAVATANAEASQTRAKKDKELRDRQEQDKKYHAEAIQRNKQLNDERARGQKAIDEQIRSLQDEAKVLNLSDRERGIQNELLKAENTARQTSYVLTDKQKQQIKDLAARRYDEGEALKVVKERYSEIAKIGEQTTDKITDAFTSMLDGNKSLSDSFKNIWIQSFKDIAANAVIRPIVQPIVGNIIGSVLGSGTALASSGGSYGSLAGGGNSTGIGDILGLGKSVFDVIGGGSSFLNGIGTSFGFGSGLAAAAPSASFIGPMPLASGSLFGTTTLGGFLGGAGLGFSAGSLLNSLVGGSSVGGTIGSGVGSLAGAAIGSIVPGIGTIIGGLLGGAGGGLFGGLFGKSKPSVGPNGVTLVYPTADRVGFQVGATGHDNGADPNVTAQGAADIVAKLNEFMKTYNLKVNSNFEKILLPNEGNQYGRVGLFQGNANAGKPRSAEELVNLLVSKNVFQGDSSTANKILGSQFSNIDDLTKALDFSKIYDQLTKTTPALNETEAAFKALRDELDSNIAQANKYGLSASALTTGYVKNFNEQITKSLLQIENPAKLAMDEFEKTAKARLDIAKQLGANITDVERLNALERERLVSQAGQQTVSNLKAWLDGQKLSAGSSLTPGMRLTEAQNQFDAAVAAARQSHDTSSLTASADNLLAISRDVMGGATTTFATREQSIRAMIANIGHELGLPGFATGGSFMVGGYGGPDSQVVAFRASPDERVTISTPNNDPTVRALAAQTSILSNKLDAVTAQLADLATMLSRERALSLNLRSAA